MTRDDQIIQTQLGQAALIRSLPPEAIRALVQQARLERYEQPSLLNARGQMLSTIRLVVQGYIELISHDIDGRASPLTQLGPGQWATLLGAFDEQPPISDFFSSPQAVYIALPAAALRQTADAHPAFYRAIIHYMGYRLRLLMEWTTRGSQLKHSRKMAALLATTARLNPLQGDSAILNFTQEKLASLTHCSRQSAQGHLAELVALGLIENGYRQIRIPSLQTLEAYAYRDGG